MQVFPIFENGPTFRFFTDFGASMFSMGDLSFPPLKNNPLYPDSSILPTVNPQTPLLGSGSAGVGLVKFLSMYFLYRAITSS